MELLVNLLKSPFFPSQERPLVPEETKPRAEGGGDSNLEKQRFPKSSPETPQRFPHPSGEGPEPCRVLWKRTNDSATGTIPTVHKEKAFPMRAVQPWDGIFSELTRVGTGVT